MALDDLIYDAAIPRTSKADVIEYYQETYGKNWTRRIAEDLYGSVKNRRGENVNVRNIQRRFQGTRASAGEGRSGAMYQELGRKLPPKAPENGFYIGGVIYVKYSKDCVERYIDPPIHITASAAQRLIDMTAQEIAQAVANAYQNDNPDAGEQDIASGGPAIGDCNPPELWVEAAE